MVLENLSGKEFAVKYFKDNLGFEPGTKQNYCTKKDYQKTLELNPDNDNGKQILLKIEKEMVK